MSKRIYFVGIGGIGMSGIAEILLNQGFRVSGSDLSSSEVTQHLASLGATIYTGHAPENLRDADVLERLHGGIPIGPRGPPAQTDPVIAPHQHHVGLREVLLEKVTCGRKVSRCWTPRAALGTSCQAM